MVFSGFDDLLILYLMTQSWAITIFFNIFNNKNDYCILYQVNLTGSGLFKLVQSGAEIGY